MPATGLVIPLVDPTTVNPPPSGSIAIVANTSGLLTVIKSDGSINPIAPINQTSAENAPSSAAGNLNVGPGNGDHVVNVAVTGIPGTRTFSILPGSLASINAGWRCKVYFDLSVAVANIRLEVFNANTSGPLLFDFTTDGIQKSAMLDVYWTGSQWSAIEFRAPSTN